MTQTNASEIKFLLAGNGPYANRGCEAIVRGSVELLSRKYSGSSFILSSFGRTLTQDSATELDPRIKHRPHIEPQTIKKYSGEWWRCKILGQSKKTPLPFSVQVQAMDECACALMLGGDNYTLDYGRPTTFVSLDEALMASGKPVVLWGCSVGPFSKDAEYESIMRDHLQALNLILARETDTVSYLESIGITDNVRLVGDPAFLMPPKEPVLSGNVANMLKRGAVGLNLSPLVGLYLEGGLGAWKETAANCVRALLEADFGPVVLVPHVTIDTPVDNDHAFLLDITRDIDGKGERFDVLPPTFSAQEYKWVISKLLGFAGTRMHSTVAALSSFVPTISLGYSSKSRGINNDLFGHLDWLLPTNDLTPESLVSRFRTLLDEKRTIIETLNTSLPGIMHKAEAAGDYIVQLLNGDI